VLKGKVPLEPGEIVTVTLMRLLPQPNYVKTLLDAYETSIGRPDMKDIQMFTSFTSIAMNISSSTPTSKQLQAFLTNLNQYPYNLGIPIESVSVVQTATEAAGGEPVGISKRVHLVLDELNTQKEATIVDIADEIRMGTMFHGNLYQYIKLETCPMPYSDGSKTYKIGLNVSPGMTWATERRGLDQKPAIQAFAEIGPIINAFTAEWRKYVLNALTLPLTAECFTMGILDESSPRGRATEFSPQIVYVSSTTSTGAKTKKAELRMPDKLDIAKTTVTSGDKPSAEEDTADSTVIVTSPRVTIDVATRFVLFLIQNAMGRAYPILGTGEYFFRTERRNLYTGSSVSESQSKPIAKDEVLRESHFVPLVSSHTDRDSGLLLQLKVELGVHYLSAGTTRLGASLDGYIPNLLDLTPSILPKPIGHAMKHVPS